MDRGSISSRGSKSERTRSAQAVTDTLRQAASRSSTRRQTPSEIAPSDSISQRSLRRSQSARGSQSSQDLTRTLRRQSKDDTNPTPRRSSKDYRRTTPRNSDRLDIAPSDFSSQTAMQKSQSARLTDMSRIQSSRGATPPRRQCERPRSSCGSERSSQTWRRPR